MANGKATKSSNKSQSIRNYLKKNKGAALKDIQAALKAEGIEVSIPLIAKVKSRGSGKKKPGRKKATAKTTAKHTAASNGAEVNKSEEIRQEYKKQGRKARPRDVVAALAERGIKVSSAQVSTIRFNMRAKKKKAGRVAVASTRSASASPAKGISAEDLLEAKRLADQLGGVERLKAALAVLDQLS